MDLSIVVVNWNTRELLAQCLECVLANPPPGDLEILVVDNASADGSPATVRERFPMVRLIENRQNVGFARANNQAIRDASGEYILLLNSDTLVQANSLGRMLAFMQTHAEAGIVGAYVLNPDHTPQRCHGRFPNLVSESAYAWGLDTRAPFSAWCGPVLDFSGDFVETDWVLGASMMVRRIALTPGAALDENYFMFSEEIDLAYCMRRDGWKNYILKTAPIVHLGQQSTKLITAAMKAELFRSKVRYFRKHHGRASAILLQSVFASSILAKRWIYQARGSKAQSVLWSETWQHFTNSQFRMAQRAPQVMGADRGLR